jgi:hypothetical protein
MEQGQQFLSETVKSRCQFCEKEIMLKNYKQHIRNVHPKKDPDDQTPFKQAGPAKVVKGKVGEGTVNRDVNAGENSLDLV